MSEQAVVGKMYAVESVALRVSIVLCMVAAVVTVLYFTPLPDKYTKSCDRPCHEFDWPMICRYKFNIEKSLPSSQCQTCSNSSECVQTCSKSIFTINQDLPGPAIHVCHNDIVLIDVTNKIPGRSLTLHFRGQTQDESPFMDGVPMITQCPITSYTTFQYKFRASTTGTHTYSAHSGSLSANGLYGALIVRQPSIQEPNKRFYDVDKKEHLLVISEWMPGFVSDFEHHDDQPTDILINGKSKMESPVFVISKGKRHRFRLAYAAAMGGGPVSISIDQHVLKIISVDGNPTAPYEARNIVLNKGERVDFVLSAKQSVGDYILRVESTVFPNVIGGGVIRYEGDRKKRSIGEEEKSVEREFNTALCDPTIGKVCIGDVHSVKKTPRALREEAVDRKFYFDFNAMMVPDIKQKDVGGFKRLYKTNNISFVYPPSPLLTQLYDVPANLMCNSLFMPEKCKDSQTCECTYIENIPLGATVELVISNQNADVPEHIFHLHGYHFFIVGTKEFKTEKSLNDLKELDNQGNLFKRNLISPVIKDTVRLPKFGVVALRFIANNPGFWMLRDEKSKMWTKGIDVVLKVGEIGDIPSAPSSFPNCGSWVGPDFFLE